MCYELLTGGKDALRWFCGDLLWHRPMSRGSRWTNPQKINSFQLILGDCLIFNISTWARKFELELKWFFTHLREQSFSCAVKMHSCAAFRKWGVPESSWKWKRVALMFMGSNPRLHFSPSFPFYYWLSAFMKIIWIFTSLLQKNTKIVAKSFLTETVFWNAWNGPRKYLESQVYSYPVPSPEDYSIWCNFWWQLRSLL